MDLIIVGVDTHKANHIAVAINGHGARLDTITIPATRKGYSNLQAWASKLGHIRAFGIEGTGSYGAGLSRQLLADGYTFLDVMRPNRQLRYLHGKSDSLDAESAARSVLNGQATALAKAQTGSSEMIRHIKVARDSAVKAKSQAMITLRTLMINAPSDLRDALAQIKGPIALIRHIAAFRPGEILSPNSSAKAAMRAIARRWLMLHEEIAEHERELDRMVSDKAPALMTSFGISIMTDAAMLILIGDNPQRIKSEAALAKCAASARFRRPVAKPTECGSIGVEIAKQMLPSIVLRSFECGVTSEPKHTPRVEPRKARPSEKSFGA